MRIFLKIICYCIFLFAISNFSSCKKEKFIKDSGAKVEFSQDSILFDTVFTTKGSVTRNFRVRNNHNQKIKISSIQLMGGSSSQFIINVDGAKGTVFTDIEIAAHDSMYVFVQVNVNPVGGGTPLIISDALNFTVNGNEQKVVLEAWGQDAYYHHPDSAIYFQDGTYFSYSLVSALKDSYTMAGTEYVWKNDKPHVIYGYLVVDEKQKLRIPAGTEVYLNYKAGLWVFSGGQLQVLGKKGNEVVFQGARRDKNELFNYLDEPGQWDRIWINEGSDQNIIDYAIIKNGYIGIQAEIFGDDTTLAKKMQLTLTNTKIYNMSKWGLYCLYYRVYAANNVISNCQENSLNITLGGGYSFIHCTFANYWAKDKPRDKPTIHINNYSESQTIPLYAYFGNCIIDGRLENELNLDLKPGSGSAPTYTYTFSNNWIKTTSALSNTLTFVNNVKGTKDVELKYKDKVLYNFEPTPDETRIKNFVHANATKDAKEIPKDINEKTRNTANVTVGAYEN